MNHVLGIDIAKLDFHVALMVGDKFYCKKFGNSSTGFKKLKLWLKAKDIECLHACMEATGRYGLKLARWLCGQGNKVSVVNPAKIKGFAQSQLSRSKTDEHDAKLIARYCSVLNPEAWKPMDDEVQELREWVDRRHDVKQIILQEKNRLELQDNTGIIASIQNIISLLSQELLEIEKIIAKILEQKPSLKAKNALLTSVPGIGKITSATVLAYLAPERFKSAKQMSAFIGLNPRQHVSGSSVRGRTRLSKTGNPFLRRSFYMPALTALKYNQPIKKFAKRLAENGKSKMVVIGAVMRKLSHIIYGILKSGQAFNPAMTTL